MYCCLINSLKKFKTGINEIPVQKNIYWACSWQNFTQWSTVKHASVPDKATFQNRCVIWCFKAQLFFLSLSHSIKAISVSVFLKSVCYFGENFSSVFFHSRSTSSSLFLPSEPSETTLPWGIHLFSQGYKF